MQPTQYRTRAGRKKTPGTYVFDSRSGRLAVFVGYCPDCNAKIMKDRDELTALFHFVRKDEAAKSYRLLKWLLNSREF